MTSPGNERRELVITPAIVETFQTLDGVSQRHFALLFENFVLGRLVTMSLAGDPRKRKPDIERLLDTDETWVMCIRQPREYQWRLFGRFDRPDRFIAVSHHLRADCGSPAQYQARANEAITEWGNLLPGCPVLRGDACSDYVRSLVRDVYAEEE